MARLDFADWNPVSFQPQLMRMTAPPRTIFLHTNGGGPQIAGPNGYFSNAFNDPGDPGMYHVGVGATVQIWKSGLVEQMCELDQIIWAQFQASRWSASIETQDDGDHLAPWTDAQMVSIAKVIEAAQIPPHLMTDATSEGIGTHQMWTPTWNQNYHDCVGPTRDHQLRAEIIPHLSNAPAIDPVISKLPLLVPGDIGHVGQATALRALINAWRGNGPLLPYKDPAGKPLDYPKDDVQLAFSIGAFQAAHGLTADFKVGPATWSALLDVKVGLPTITSKDMTHWGQWILNVRSLLGARGYWLLPRTGGWDKSFNDCLTDFQTKHGCSLDGPANHVGGQTWAALLGVSL